MTREVFLDTFESRFDEQTGDSRGLVSLIAEVARRRESTAAPFLVRVCCRHAGFDRSRAVPDGQLGHRPIKKVLESRLQTAAIDEISKIVDALVPVSDEETAVSLGQLVERVSDEKRSFYRRRSTRRVGWKGRGDMAVTAG